MPLKYHSGEEIKTGDKVIFHQNPGEIELVADPDIPDPETDWYIQEYERGVMIREPKQFGRAFISHPEEAEDLTFVSRARTSPLSKSG